MQQQQQSSTPLTVYYNSKIKENAKTTNKTHSFSH